MDFSKESLEQFMRAALAQAKKASSADEVPVGAVVVHDNQIIAEAHNQTESRKSPIAHAEILVLEQAAKKLGDWRLSECSLLVTLEPCTMCTGALRNARIGNLIFGAFEERLGACGSLYDLSLDERLGKTPRVISGILAEESKDLLVEFFQKKRT